MDQELKPIKGYGWLWFVGIGIIVLAISLGPIKKEFQKEANPTKTITPFQQRVTELKIIKFVLKPGEEKKYSVPPNHWFRAYSEGKVKVKTWDGREMDGTAWLGDEIRDANLRFKSYDERDAVVIITLRPK